MRLRALGLAGLAALVGGAAVTEVALRWVAFSLFVGVPAGLAAGVVVAAAVLLGLVEDAPAGRRRAATAIGGFGATFLVVLVAAASVGGQGVVVSLVVAGVVGSWWGPGWRTSTRVTERGVCRVGPESG